MSMPTIKRVDHTKAAKMPWLWLWLILGIILVLQGINYAQQGDHQTSSDTWFGWTHDRTRTVNLPLTPYEMTLEPGEKSPDFMLSQNGSWRVCLTPHVEILPYVTFINERRVNGERAFDGYRIENTSSGPIWFSTWQEQPPVGQVRATCN